MWYKDVGTMFFCFVTIIHAFDRRTDGQTDRRKGVRNGDYNDGE